MTILNSLLGLKPKLYLNTFGVDQKGNLISATFQPQRRRGAENTQEVINNSAKPQRLCASAVKKAATQYFLVSPDMFSWDLDFSPFTDPAKS